VTARTLALVLGVLYLGLGVLGLMPGALAGLFPLNPALALVHLAIGAWGIAAYIGRAPASSPGDRAPASAAACSATAAGRTRHLSPTTAAKTRTTGAAVPMSRPPEHEA
jgi:uncharacterized protein DUF4383